MTANTKMTEERAKEIIAKENHNCFGGCDSEWHEIEAEAKGFLEGLQAGRAEMAEECISIVQKDCDAGFCKNKEHEFGCSQCCIEAIRNIAQRDGGKNV